MAGVTILAVFTLALRLPFFGNGSAVATIEFVNIANRPYSISEVLTHYMVDDRQFMEHAIESMATNSLTDRSVEDKIVKLFSDYRLGRFYIIRIKDNEGVIYSTGSRSGTPAARCGDRFDGFCAAGVIGVTQPAGECGVGFIETTGGENVCPRASGLVMTCCVFSPEKYPQEGVGGFDVVKCGKTLRGVCNPVARGEEKGDFLSICPGSTTGVDDAGVCENANSGQTPICCQALEEVFAETGFSATAEIPIFYRGEKGVIEVTVS